MHNAIPPIHEEVVALKERLRHEHDGHKKPRLQMLYLLAGGQAHGRQEVARLLGVQRTRFGAGWPCMPRAVSRPYWPPMSRPASPSPSHPTCSPAWSRRSTGLKASPPILWLPSVSRYPASP
jgi:hypothetical protein